MSPTPRPLFSHNADARKISFSPSNASRATAFAMKHNVQTEVCVIEMQMELSDLRKRVKILDSNTGRNELLSKLKEQEVENRRKEQQLHSLNDKFHQVRKGLVQIDEEREKLRSAKEQLEKDNKEIQRQLDIREKEVLLLAKRCSSQEQKMKERSRLRASNNELATEMEGLRSSLTLRDEEISQIDALRNELKECQDSRQALIDRLAKVKKDHDDVVETLNSCFQNIHMLNESKAEVEEERQREMQRAQLDMEQQRLAHLDATNELRAQVQLRQDRIEQMEQILKENMSVCTSLRKEKAEWNTTLQLELSKLKEVHAAERNALNRENDKLVQNVHDEYDAVLNEMRSKLEEKDNIVSSLEDEVSDCMQKMMSLSTDLQKLHDEKRIESTIQTKAIAALEEERDALEELACARDREIAKLSASIETLEQEKNALASQLVDLRHRIEELEEENAFIMDLESQLHDVNTSMIEVKEEKDSEREEFEMTVALLQQELDDERSMWASMEQGLQEKICALEKKHELAKESSAQALSEARQVLQSVNDSSSTTEDALRLSLAEVQRERSAREALEKELACVKSAVAESQMLSASDNKRIEMLESELSKAREAADLQSRSSEEQLSALRSELESARELHEKEVASNFQAIEFKEQALDSVQTELRKVREAYKREVSSLQNHLNEEQNEVSSLRSQLSEARITVGAEATASQRILAEKDATITSLTTEISILKSKALAQDKVFRQSMSQREDQVVQVTDELEASRLALEYEKAERARETKKRDDALAATRAELEELRSSSDSEIANGKRLISEQAMQLSSLETELTKVRLTAEEEVAQCRKVLVSKENELSCLREQLDELKSAQSQTLDKSDRELSALQKLLDESREHSVQKDKEILSLKAELDEASVAWTENEASHRQQLELANNASETLQQELYELRQASRELQTSSTASLRERDDVIARLQLQLSEARQALEGHTVESDEALTRSEKSLALTKAELEQARSDAATARTLASETIEQRESVIESLRSDLDEARKALAKEKSSGNVSLHAKEEIIVALQSQLTQAKLQSEREKAALKKDVSEKDSALELLRTELEDLGRSRTSDAAMQEKRMEAKDALIEDLKADFEDLHVRAESDAKSCREQIARLKIEVQKTSTNLAIREDEIRDLKLIDLKEAEETIASLESQLAGVRQNSVRREAEASGIQAKLQSQLTELKTMNSHLQQKITDMSQQNSKALVTLNDEVAALKQAKENAETHSQELSSKLQERHSSITVLTRKNTLLEQRERSLQSQMERAAQDVRLAKEEKEKALSALDFEINRHRANREDDDITFQRRCASLETDLQDSKAKLAAQKERTAEVERLLQERTKLLGDMVASNKETEDEKEQALAHMTDLQDAVDRLDEESESAKRELAQVRELQKKREDQLLATIHDERHSREIAEADLEAVQAKLRSVRHDNRDVNELEKENLVLRDKVRRQEDYLKRKLQKEKVLRDRKARNVTTTPNNSRNVMATPRRIPSPSKRRTVPASVGVKTTASTAMSVLSESSFPDESWGEASSFRS